MTQKIRVIRYGTNKASLRMFDLDKDYNKFNIYMAASFLMIKKGLVTDIRIMPTIKR